MADSDGTLDFDPNSMEYLSQATEDSSLSSFSNSHSNSSPASQFVSRDRPYPCHVCNKRFTQKAHLIIHKRIHTGEKPYACHICHKRFAQSSHLTVHKRVHTGEKPFFCNFCGMGFCRKPRLEAHILQHVVKEGRQLPSNLKGNVMSSLSMVGLGDASKSISQVDGLNNQESLDAAAQLMELKMKGGIVTEVKTEPLDITDDNDIVKSVMDEVNGAEKGGEGDSARKKRKPDFVRRLGSKDSDTQHSIGDGDGSGHGSDKNLSSISKGDFSNNSSVLGLSPDDLEKFASSLTELTDLQRQPSNQSMVMGASKNQINNFIENNIISNTNNSRSTPSSSMMNPSLTMTGMVRTNTRISLVDFTAEDILQHLMTRDDVKSCDFCCIVFHDPAMYYLHKSMHDKMDVRCCNLCGKLLVDKYDFTAHFLSQHR